MQVRGAPRTLYPGEPLCVPAPVVVVESIVNLLRQLHGSSTWTPHVNSALLDRYVNLLKMYAIFTIQVRLAF